jgi:hypothetical protein
MCITLPAEPKRRPYLCVYYFSLMWTRTDVGQPFAYYFLTNVTARSYDWA